MIELQPFSIPILLSLGVILMGLEMLVGSFYIFWFGIGFFVVGIIEYFVPFSGAIYQISTALIISLILLFTLKKRVNFLLSRSEKEIKDDFLNEEGEGIIKEGMVFYKGTMWLYEPRDLKLKEGAYVKVLSTKGNLAIVEKIDKN